MQPPVQMVQVIDSARLITQAARNDFLSTEERMQLVHEGYTRAMTMLADYRAWAMQTILESRNAPR